MGLPAEVKQGGKLPEAPAAGEHCFVSTSLEQNAFLCPLLCLNDEKYMPNTNL